MRFTFEGTTIEVNKIGPSPRSKLTEAVFYQVEDSKKFNSRQIEKLATMSDIEFKKLILI